MQITDVRIRKVDKEGKMKAIVPEFKSRHSKYEVLDKALESASTDA